MVLHRRKKESESMNIQNGCVILRAIEKKDFGILFQMINSPELEKALGSFTLPVNEEQQKEWMENYRNTDKQIRFMIDLTNGTTIGTIMLYHIDMKNGTAEIGYKTGVEKERRMPGDMDAAMQGILRYGFGELRLNCIEARVLADNGPSERYLMRNGFLCEGVLRQRVYQSNHYEDMKVFSILKEEYEASLQEDK